jgi:hypothetical protein
MSRSLYSARRNLIVEYKTKALLVEKRLARKDERKYDQVRNGFKPILSW